MQQGRTVLTSVVYKVQMIPVENNDTHMLSPVAEIKEIKFVLRK